MDLTDEIKSLLRSRGADLVGIGDMSKVDNCGYQTGISVAVALPGKTVRDLEEAPTKEYYLLYDLLNKKLNSIVTAGEEYLKGRGFEAYAQTTERAAIDGERCTGLPHKTVATRAGLGWIGKNCLLVTPRYGPAVRISSLMTNAPLKYDEPTDRSYCGECRKCVENCPGDALKGCSWTVGMPRAEIVDVEKCYSTQIEIMTKSTGIAADLCGKCFAVCPYTKRTLKDRPS